MSWILRRGAVALLAPALLLLAGCPDSELARGVVTNLPDGDATGSAHSGRYRLDIETEACIGECPNFAFGIFTVVICKVGGVRRPTVTADQQGGRLVVSGTSSLYVERFEGGIYANGAYDVGGYQNVQGVDVTARIRGTIGSDGKITGEAILRGTGSASGTRVNCEGQYRITGDKL